MRQLAALPWVRAGPRVRCLPARDFQFGDLIKMASPKSTQGGAAVMGGGHGAVNRRDFLFVAAGAVGAVGVAATAWPFIHQMNPAADVLALAEIEVELE